MIDSITLFTKTGIVLYHYVLASQSNVMDPMRINLINQILSLHLLSPSDKTFYLKSTTPEWIAEWYSSNASSSTTSAEEQKEDIMAVVLYPKIVKNHADTSWLSEYMKQMVSEYQIFQQSSSVKLWNHRNVACQNNMNAMHQVLYESCQKVGRTSKSITMPTRPPPQSILSSSSKKGKENRVWHDSEQKVTSKAMASLDFSLKKEEEEDRNSDQKLQNALLEARAAYLPNPNEIPAWEEDDVIQDEVDGTMNHTESSFTSSTGWGSSLKGMMDQFSGKVLTEADLVKPLEEMEKMLTSKNVATETAQVICNGLRVKLVGKKMTSFTRVKSAVRQALEATIEKILRPGKGRGGIEDVDILRQIVAKRERGISFFTNKSEKAKPFVIVMVGINGVGKSTSLAKIAYYLKSQGCNPLLAACDTFRSGAVEQLNVHAKCLEVPLYHKGYAKDPAAVAKAAIEQATTDGNDVVLVDTAGRMQNNVPLMKALSNLVVQNNPDMVLFVCEALVGNDGMDQLEMFNKALRSGGHSRKIDGIVLTKFDTVSDKVGAALTMTHVTGSPVVFVGTGQKYNHLKKLSVQSVIKSIFS